ncbi:hypothetical protein [Varunaivibrio sulfuroxidans]|uniref:Peptidase MA superfamily protein n=1 Tax=Varunaivibrio sulfuroxidans TaxID=1773489 RepID=A0A4R3JAT3_9PROT|nr:hypothetical protein [Varunaivibrio sulfuroxidans]TCS62133.1 hypothetical protein EDD55_10691 [Varunaivibrio sulfuroxidans]WES30565.1 hypothetical protein P3M64_13130 [Varunaivibrio sulfuroxidans]
MKASHLFGVIGVVCALCLGGAVSAFPAVTAYLCPSCYGLSHLGRGLYVEDTSRAQKDLLLAAVSTAEEKVGSFYGAFHHRPTLLVCFTDNCDRRLGGRGARAMTYGAAFVYISPRGLNGTILAHEFAHIELNRRIGFWAMLTNAVPAWFNEGLAVLISGDERYLPRSKSGGEGCGGKRFFDLPANTREWRRQAGKPGGSMYAEAFCDVSLWIRRHGGKEGVRATLSDIRNGGVFPTP